MTADNIAAKTITASKLYIGDTSNMFPDPEFADLTNATGGYTLNGDMASAANFTSSPAARLLIISVTNGGTNVRAIGPAIPVDQNTSYYASCYFGISGSLGCTAQVALVFYSDAEGTVTLPGSTTIGLNTTVAQRNELTGAQVVSVATAKSCRFHFIRVPSTENSAAVFSFPYMRRAASAELIVDGAITADKIAANAITAVKILAGTITGDKVAANTISGDRIVANAITARELVLTDFSNRNVNGGFENGTWANELVNASFQTVRTLDAATYGVSYTDSGAYSLQLIKPTVDDNCIIQTTAAARVSVTAGQDYFFETAVRALDASSAIGFNFLVAWFDNSGAPIGSFVSISSNAAMSGAWTSYSGKRTAPSGAKTVGIRITHSPSSNRNILIDRIVVREANAASLVVDGSIVAAHLAANSVTADKIAANSIVAGKIATNAVTAATIAANAITSTKIAANAVTATHINVTNLAAISATLGAVNITNAIIGDLIVGTSNLGFRAVTSGVDYSLPQQINGNNNSGSWITLAGATVVTQNPEQTPVFCEFGLTTSVTASTGSISYARVRWRHVESGDILKQAINDVAAGGGGSVTQTVNNIGFFLHTTPVVGTNTYVLEFQNQRQASGSNSLFAFVRSVWWKK